MTDFRFFTLKELCSSDVATKKKIDNFPSWAVVEHLAELTEKILEPLRVAWGGPIKITSGYRCDALNRAVGGVYNSVHRLGYAADLQPGNGRMDDFIRFTKEWLIKTGTRFDQLIEEQSGSVRWLHIGIKSSTGSQRGQFLNITK